MWILPINSISNCITNEISILNKRETGVNGWRSEHIAREYLCEMLELMEFMSERIVLEEDMERKE